jgi:hypothetical protein
MVHVRNVRMDMEKPLVSMLVGVWLSGGIIGCV